MEPTTPAPTTPMEWSTATTVILALIAILAVVTVLAILRGARQRRLRRDARRAEEDRLAGAASPLPDIKSQAAPVKVPGNAPSPIAASAPVAPPPPPLDTASTSEATVAPTLDDAPIAAAAPLDASLASEAAAPVSDAPAARARPITMLKGLGPRVAALLAEQGVTTVGDLAALSDDEAATLDARLGPFTGRMSRDRWLEQARLLAAGDDKGFEAVFGRL